MACTLTHGKCERCRVVYRWAANRAMKLREAACPACGDFLARTAAALVKTMPIVNMVPIDREGRRATELRAAWGEVVP